MAADGQGKPGNVLHYSSGESGRAVMTIMYVPFACRCGTSNGADVEDLQKAMAQQVINRSHEEGGWQHGIHVMNETS
jgi:hypothetical protein